MEGVGDHREARRPMNSFFIFCKRHRSMVRDHHQNLDNRSISRILGELWAKLDPREKQQYTLTAKQYKDAFLKANPDYKWHNNDKSHLMSTATNFAAMNQVFNDSGKNHEKLDRDSPVDSNNMDLLFMAIQQNKDDFAAQLLRENDSAGELSSSPQKDDVLSPSPIKHEPGNVNANIEYAVRQGWACGNEEESHMGIPEIKYPEYPAKESSSPPTSSPIHMTKDGNESDGSKSHMSDASMDATWTKSSSFDHCRQVDYALPTRKSKRANKGAIYKNLIATGALPASRERLAEIQTIYNVNSDDGSEMKETQCYEQSVRRFKRTASESDTQSSDKRYKTGDFDLDAKIATLPACSMDVLEKNRRNANKTKSSPENSRRGHNASVIKTDMLLTPPCRLRRPVSSPIKGCGKRKQSKGSIMRCVPLSEEFKHQLPNLRRNPLAQFYLHPTMKSYQNLVNQKPTSPPVPDSVLHHDQAVSASDDSFESKNDNNSSVAMKVEPPSNQKAEKVIPIDVPTFTASVTIPTTTKIVAPPTTPSVIKVSTKEKPIVQPVVYKANSKSVARVVPSPPKMALSTHKVLPSPHKVATSPHKVAPSPYKFATSPPKVAPSPHKVVPSIPKVTPSPPKRSILAGTPSMPNVYKASVSSMDLSLRSTQVTGISAQMTATHTPNIPLAAITAAAAVSEPMQTPAPLDLGPTSSGLHVSGELKVKLGNQSPKQSKLSDNPDFKIWISNLAEAAERAGQISVC